MKWDIVSILSCFLLGFYLIFSPILIGVGHADLFKTLTGILLMIMGIGVFYNKAFFSPNIKKFLLTLFGSCILIGIILIIYDIILSLTIYNLLNHANLLFLLLSLIIIVSYFVILVVANKREFSIVNRGIEFVADSNYGEALDYFDNLLKLDPKNATVWSYKSQTFLLLNRYDEALKSVNNALL
jgi:tetratricopeptide (TPR) repeat protein